MVPVDIVLPVELPPIEPMPVELDEPIEPAPPVVWAVAAIGNIIAAAAIESAIRIVSLLFLAGS